MAWTSMHFAAGLGGAGLAGAAICALSRRGPSGGGGWRWLPLAMTAGGFWALVPDLPRLFREDFPWLPLSSTLGDKSLEGALHRWGDLFFFHNSLDAQPHEYALHGLILIILFYNLGTLLLMYLARRQRHSLANRAWQAHQPFVAQTKRKSAA